MAHPILSEDWSEYDNKKIRDKRDRDFFSCEESWEVEFLVRRIRKYVPASSDYDIRNAISACCRSIPGNKPRTKFVECVMSRL